MRVDAAIHGIGVLASIEDVMEHLARLRVQQGATPVLHEHEFRVALWPIALNSPDPVNHAQETEHCGVRCVLGDLLDHLTVTRSPSGRPLNHSDSATESELGRRPAGPLVRVVMQPVWAQ